MKHQKHNTQPCKGTHINWNKRMLIEGFLKAGKDPLWISIKLGKHKRTIKREIEMGLVTHLNTDLTTKVVYSADRAHEVHIENGRNKGPKVKLKVNSVAYKWIVYHLVKQKWSPEAVAGRMKLKGMEGAVCAKTLYTYIDRGEIEGISNESLWEKRTRGKSHKSLQRKQKRSVSIGHSIEDRPDDANDRTTEGHWEIDLIVSGTGKGAAALLTLVERKSRNLLIRKVKDKSQKSITRAINGIERLMGKDKFRSVFTSITADNGSEFLGINDLERSVYTKTRRTHIYYAHPYASWERGTNENTNRMIRRFIPKGSDISKISRKQIKTIEDWINKYPRKILNYKTAEEMFNQVFVA